MTIDELKASFHDDKLDALLADVGEYIAGIKILSPYEIEVFHRFVPCTDSDASGLMQDEYGNELSVKWRSTAVHGLLETRNRVFAGHSGPEDIKGILIYARPDVTLLHPDECEIFSDMYIESGPDYHLLILRSKWAYYEYHVPAPLEAIDRLFVLIEQNGIDESLINK